MEEEIEDIVGEVKLTDSQKSVATSNVYSMEFTDSSSSDKNNSSGKDTYVIEQYDSDDSDSYPVHEDRTVIDLKNNKKNKDADAKKKSANKIISSAASAIVNCSVVAQEIFTQTSKTIFELAQAEGNRETLETQTSFVSITENRTFQYKIQMSNGKEHVGHNYQTVLTNALEDESSKFQGSDSDTIKSDANSSSEVSSGDRLINILDVDSKDNVLSDENHEAQYENTSDFEESDSSDNSIEEDSLIETKERVQKDAASDMDLPKCVDREIEDLYNKLTASRELHAMDRITPDQRQRTLTPLTEESTVKKDSLNDLTSGSKQIEHSVEESDRDVVFTNYAGGKVKMLPKEESKEFKLPPIQNRSCPNSPHLNFLFSVHPSNKLNKAGTLPCLYEASERRTDRWEIETKDLASGESPLISGRSAPIKNSHSIHLPPIHIEGYVVNSKISKIDPQSTIVVSNRKKLEQEDINIKEKIRELKMAAKSGKPKLQFTRIPISDSRSCSPSSGESQESKFCGALERGCDALCVELLKKLRSTTWYEVVDTLEEIPKALDKFWGVIAENRVADLIRQVSAHVESPRTQVSRTACNTLASIVKNTNYTKKPDFYEAVTLLLTKTSSFSRPVRRAANVALDSVVSGVDFSHAVTALCVHGVHHKSPLVRCAAARLVVVSCALAGGGRGLLRARPPSAAAARRHVLRALADLLHDKNTDARKYAERLYVMLRPLENFEAYYLTDVDVELASRQMKKYDRTLFTGAKDAR